MQLRNGDETKAKVQEAVNKMNEMSFSRFVYPENKEAVLDELQQSFKA